MNAYRSVSRPAVNGELADSGLVHILSTALDKIQVCLVVCSCSAGHAPLYDRSNSRNCVSLTLAFAQKRPWTLHSFLHLSHSATAAWNASSASSSAHESVGRLNLDFHVVTKLLMKKGAEYGAFEQLPRKKEHYFQTCSSKLMRHMLPNWCV
jgi:hypothetical protein